MHVLSLTLIACICWHEMQIWWFL